MPTLNWIGKEKVIRHHQDVPFRILEHKYGFSPEKAEQKEESRSGNMIIHGDNLEALKALLPYYEGKIKCIYIDPPYNTGNESWVYNDNVNHPKIKKWLGQVVGKEGDDLSRHDKWLCMMYPRLKLLQKLLSDDGAIFISIDDNEQANLKLICDEIFGSNNFIGNICWQKKQSPQNDAINFSDMHDFIIVYAKRKKKNRNDLSGWQRNLLPKTEKQNSRYKNPDNDIRGKWASVDCTSNKTKYERPNLFYEIINPITKEKILPPENRVWRFEKNKFNALIAENRIWWGKDGQNFPRLKRFKNEMEKGVVPSTWWGRNDFGDNQEARRLYRCIFEDVDDDFTTPKPITLLKNIITISSDKNAIIIDSFAGSGTTAHAVLNLNQEDGGNRRFILIEMEDYAQSITAERVKRVMTGYGKDKKAMEGTGGSFDYFTLGPRMFLNDKNLNEEIGEERIREYIWYSETRSAFVPPEDSGKSPYFLGIKNDTAYYFYYRKDRITTLNYEFVEHLTANAEQYLIYADVCTLSEDFMKARNILFKKIPRDIKRF